MEANSLQYFSKTCFLCTSLTKKIKAFLQITATVMEKIQGCVSNGSFLSQVGKARPLPHTTTELKTRHPSEPCFSKSSVKRFSRASVFTLRGVTGKARHACCFCSLGANIHTYFMYSESTEMKHSHDKSE